MMTIQTHVTLLITATSVAAVLLSPGAAAGSDWPVREESTISRTLRFDGTGEHTLDVRTLNGSIHVVGTSRSDIQLDARKTIRAETPVDLRVAAEEVTLDIIDNASRIEVIEHGPNGAACGDESNDDRGRWWDSPYVVKFDFTIQVPRGTRLRLCTINGQEILVEATDGRFDLDNVNGRITMDKVRGSGRVRTVNGAITASFAESPREASEFTTVNGNVAVTFPADLTADLRMNTFRGGLFTDFDVEPLPQPATVAERRGTGFVYRTGQFTLVRVGRGGPELTLQTFNGNVRVRRAAH